MACACWEFCSCHPLIDLVGGHMTARHENEQTSPRRAVKRLCPLNHFSATRIRSFATPLTASRVPRWSIISLLVLGEDSFGT